MCMRVCVHVIQHIIDRMDAYATVTMGADHSLLCQVSIGLLLLLW